MQEDYGPPSLPERNDAALQQQQQHLRVNHATQKLHEILTTPRKPRKRTQSEALSPIKSPQMQPMLHGVHRNAYTPTHSPSSNAGEFLSLWYLIFFKERATKNVEISVNRKIKNFKLLMILYFLEKVEYFKYCTSC